jgi:hypothetical protein
VSRCDGRDCPLLLSSKNLEALTIDEVIEQFNVTREKITAVPDW